MTIKVRQMKYLVTAEIEGDASAPEATIAKFLGLVGANLFLTAAVECGGDRIIYRLRSARTCTLLATHPTKANIRRRERQGEK